MEDLFWLHVLGNTLHHGGKFMELEWEVPDHVKSIASNHSKLGIPFTFLLFIQFVAQPMGPF